LFWEVYIAFDAGEFVHPGDDRSVDPVEKYTRPLIDETWRSSRASAGYSGLLTRRPTGQATPVPPRPQ
jgi:hypothetical protein